MFIFPFEVDCTKYIPPVLDKWRSLGLTGDDLINKIITDLFYSIDTRYYDTFYDYLFDYCTYTKYSATNSSLDPLYENNSKVKELLNELNSKDHDAVVIKKFIKISNITIEQGSAYELENLKLHCAMEMDLERMFTTLNVNIMGYLNG